MGFVLMCYVLCDCSMVVCSVGVGYVDMSYVDVSGRLLVCVVLFWRVSNVANLLSALKGNSYKNSENTFSMKN